MATYLHLHSSLYEMSLSPTTLHSLTDTSHPVLGRGVFGTVVLVKYQGTHYAVKRQCTRDSHGFYAAVREDYCGGFDHPNLVRRFSSWWSDYTWFGVFEVGQKMPHNAQSQRVMWDILSGLSFLHARGIAHRDVKPSNIIQVATGDDYIYKLIDFGLSRPLALTDRRQTLYTVSRHWRPPELLRGGRTDCRCDVWSIGVVCLTLSRGKRVFCGSADAILRQFEQLVLNGHEWIYSKFLCELDSRWTATELCVKLGLDTCETAQPAPPAEGDHLDTIRGVAVECEERYYKYGFRR